jgi:hypothetical protein
MLVYLEAQNFINGFKTISKQGVIMQIMQDLEQIFNRKYGGEIVKIAPKKRDEILQEAQTFVAEKFADIHGCDGGELTDLNSAITQSLMEMFVRNTASKTSCCMLKIDAAVYEAALLEFRDFINKKCESFDILQAFWLQTAKACISVTFQNEHRVFKTYLIGELCENLFIDNKVAEAVIKELKARDFIYSVGSQHNIELLERGSKN